MHILYKLDFSWLYPVETCKLSFCFDRQVHRISDIKKETVRRWTVNHPSFVELGNLSFTIEVFAIYRAEQSSEQTWCIHLVSDNNSRPFVSSNMRDLSGACILRYAYICISTHNNTSINLRVDDGVNACMYQYTYDCGITDLWYIVCNTMTNWHCKNKSTAWSDSFLREKYTMLPSDEIRPQ